MLKIKYSAKYRNEIKVTFIFRKRLFTMFKRKMVS